MALTIQDFVDENGNVSIGDISQSDQDRINDALAELTADPSGPATGSPTAISDWNDLADIRNDLSANYVLINDLDEDSPGYDDVINPEDGGPFKPIGWVGYSSADPFTGSFDGNGHTIADLKIVESNGDGFGNMAGLFGWIESTSVTNLTFRDATVESSEGNLPYAGTLAGFVNNSEITDVTVENTDVTNINGEPKGAGAVAGTAASTEFHRVTGSGSVTDEGTGSRSLVGGLAGAIYDSGGRSPLIRRCSADVDVVGPHGEAGGLVGRVGGDNVRIERSSAGGTVTNPGNDAKKSGGLIGVINDVGNSSTSGTVKIKESEFDGSMDVDDQAGGLVGRVSKVETVIRESAMRGSLEFNIAGGGLVGRTDQPLTITDSFSTASITLADPSGESPSHITGGLVGDVRDTTTLENVYAAGSIAQGDDTDQIGGIAGKNDSSSIGITNQSVYYVDTLADSDIDGGNIPDVEALSAGDMKDISAMNSMSEFFQNSDIWETQTDDFPDIQALQ